MQTFINEGRDKNAKIIDKNENLINKNLFTEKINEYIVYIINRDHALLNKAAKKEL